MNILNILISSVLIYGLFSWPGLGFVGAGLGLTIARYIGAIATIWVLMVGLNPALRLSLKGYFKPFNFAIIWEVMGIGIPASIESVLFNGGKLLTQMFVAGMGTNVIAGNFIAFSVASLINLPGNALGSASTIITGKRLGKGQIGQAEFQAWHVFWLSTIILTLIAWGSAPFAGFIASFYTHEEDVKEVVKQLLCSTPCLCRSGRCRGLYPAPSKAPVTYAIPCGCRCSVCGAAGWWRAIRWASCWGWG